MEQSKKIITSDDLTRDEWFKHIDGWANGTESQPNYCKTHGLSLNSFAYWRQVYLSGKKSKKPVGFSKMTPISEPKPVDYGQIRLSPPSGVTMLISGNPTPEML